MAYFRNQQDNTIRQNSIFSANTRSITILSPQNVTFGQHPGVCIKHDNEKIYRKYYSKKIVNLLICFRSSPSASAHRCKSVKHLKISGSALKRTPIPSAKTLSLHYGVRYTVMHREFDPTLEQNRPTFINQLAGYKFLEKFVFYCGLYSISLYHLRTLPNLRSVSLTLNKYQLVSNAKTLLTLRSLENFKLDLRNPKMITENDYLRKTINFCVNIMALKTIKSVTFNFASISFDQNPKLFENFIDGLHKSRPARCDVRLLFPNYTNIDAFDINQLQTTLDYFDLLILRIRPGFVIGLDQCNHNKNETSISSSDKVLRKLDLILPTTMDAINQNKIEESQPTIISQSLDILFRKAISSPFLLQAARNFQSLKYLTFTFHDLDSLKIEEISESVSNVLKESHSLKNLVLIQLKIKPVDEFRNTQMFAPLLDQISSLNNLESLYLQDVSVPVASIGLIERMLSPLSSLRMLSLVLNIDVNKGQEVDISLSLQELTNLTALLVSFTLPNFCQQVNLSLPLDKLNNLVNLQLVLPDMNRQSQINLVDSIGKLTSLEELDLKEPVKWLRNKSVRSSLFQGLWRLRKLKSVSVNYVDYRMQFLAKSPNVDLNKRLATKIKEEAEELFRQNRSIERFIANEEGSYEVDVVRQ